MNERTTSRREFLAATGGIAGSLWLSLHWRSVEAAAHEAHAAATSEHAPTLKWLSATEAADTDALSACIVPSGETPGAREARVVVFIDRALSSFFAGQADEFRSGLQATQRKFSAAHAGKAFAAASAEQQIAFMQTIESSPFFTQLRLLTIVGLLSSPKYGGNFGGLGWKVMGFADRHAFVAPFGYYDRNYAGFEPYLPSSTPGAES